MADSDDEIDVSLEIDLDTFEDVSMIESDDEEEEELDLSRPIKMVYCGSCGLPPEFCDWGGKKAACKTWKEEHAPHLLPGYDGQLPTVQADGAIRLTFCSVFALFARFLLTSCSLFELICARLT